MKRLEEAVAVPLRAGVTIPSLAQCVEELVLNSIDAHARSLTIRVSVEKGFIEIADDGDGIPATSFECLGEPYNSSKGTSLEDLTVAATYGFRGEALLAIRMLSECLEIRSRHTTSGFTSVKTFNRGVALPVRRTTEFSSRGTTVTVRKLFYNFPVRHASLLSPSNVSHVCHTVKAVLLVHPRVSVVLKDNRGDVLVTSARAASSVELFSCFFDREKARKLRAVCHFCGVYKLSGWICRDGHTNQSFQFVYVNHKLVQDDGIKELLDVLFQNSVITQRMYDGHSMSTQPLHSVYILNLLCPNDECIFTIEPGKRLVEFFDYACVLYAFRSLVSSFLARECLYRHIVVPTTVVPWNTKHQVTTVRSRQSTVTFPPRPELGAAVAAYTSLVTSQKVMRQIQKRISMSTVNSNPSIEECNALVRCHLVESTTDLACPVATRRPLVVMEDDHTVSQQYQSSGGQQKATTDLTGTAAKRPLVDSMIGSAVNELVINQTVSSRMCSSVTDNWEATKLSSLTISSHLTKSFRFSKDMLTKAKVIGQVNGEFIACVVTSGKAKAQKQEELSLVLVDQHAAHERVRLEELEDELTSKGRLSSDPIHPPVIIPLPDLSRRLSARGIYNKLERWGIVGRISANNGRQEMSIVKAPTILMKSGSSEVSSVETLKNLIAELISNQQWSSPGTGWPISLAEVLHSKACHGAIRFGDNLTKCQCIQLVKKLAKCRLAFQCAHGRPTVQPLGNIDVLEKQE